MLKDLLFKSMAVLMLVSMTNLANGQGMSCDMAEVITFGTYTLSDTIPMNGNNVGNPDDPDFGPATGAVWYSYTPATSGIVNINSCGGGSDTRLSVHTGDCANPTFFVGNDDFCAFAADGTGDAYASSVNFEAEAGVTYLIEWDNRWTPNTAFTFTVDLATPDIAAAHLSQYLQLPESQSDLWGLIGNIGATEITDGVLTADVYDAADLTTPIFTVSSEPQTLTAGQIEAINLGPWTPVVGNSYVITYSAMTADEGEAQMANNAEQGQAFEVTNFVYALDTAADNGFGTTGGEEIVQGNLFTFYTDDVVESVSLGYGGGVAGEAIALTIWSVDATGVPIEEIYNQTLDLAAGTYTVVLDTPFEAAQGSVYFVGTRSTTAGNVGLDLDTSNYYPGVSIFNTGGAGWNDSSAVLPFVYTVRLNVESDITEAFYTFNVDMSNETVSADGVNLAGNVFDNFVAMTDDDGDGIYSATASVPINTDIEYIFVNGEMEIESVPVACGLAIDGGIVRQAPGIVTDAEIASVCFSACQGCFPAAPEVAPCDMNAGTLICDNLDGYTAGDAVSDQAVWWTPWPGADSAPVSSDFAQSGANSMVIAGGGGTDQVLVLPNNATEGTYYLSWSYYIPAGGAAYFNLQGDGGAIGTIFKMECNMSANAGALTVAGVATPFAYPEDTWFDVNMVIDLDAAEATLYVAGSGVSTWDFTNDAAAAGGTSQLGGVNFFPIDATYNAYVDDVSVIGPTAELSLTVGTSSIDVDPAGMFLAGQFNGWSNGDMTDNGNDTWSATVTVPANQTIEYKFKNGNEGWEEGIMGDCVLDNGNRFVEVGGGATEVDEVCFLSCTAVCLSSTQDVAFDAGITVTPNPTSGVFSVNYDLETSSDLEIRITNVLGQTIAVRTIDAATTGAESFDLSNFAAGTYTLVTTSGERLSTKRIVMQ